jgi:FlaG/FlaF family flagellin (archaellin)
MVAIVVVLATVISAVALGVTSGTTSPVPQVSFEFNADYTTGDIIVTKRAGNTFNGDYVKFSGAALEKTTYGSITEWTGKGVRAGDSAAVDVKPGETLRLIWQSPNGRTEAILAKYEVPNDVGPTASIGSVNAGLGQTSAKINNIRFSRVTDGTVYVVVKEGRRNSPTKNVVSESVFSTNGGDLTVTGLSRTNRRSEITVTVYETDDKLTDLTNTTCTFGLGAGCR